MIATATKTKTLLANTARNSAPSRTGLPSLEPAIILPPFGVEEAIRIVRMAAVDRFERARSAFEALESRLAPATEGDPALDFYAAILVSELCDSEWALVDALLCPDHEGGLNAPGGYHWAVHEPVSFAHAGKVYSATVDPGQDLELGQVGSSGPAMVLQVEDAH